MEQKGWTKYEPDLYLNAVTHLSDAHNNTRLSMY